MKMFSRLLGRDSGSNIQIPNSYGEVRALQDRIITDVTLRETVERIQLGTDEIAKKAIHIFSRIAGESDARLEPNLKAVAADVVSLLTKGEVIPQEEFDAILEAA